MDGEQHSGRMLGEFLRAKRSRTRPERFGITTGRRRVVGLKREEVATLAGISTDYYQRVEQGRVVPSDHVLAAIGKVLELDETELFYLRSIARPHPPGPIIASVPDNIDALVSAINDLPVFVIDGMRNVLRWNRLAAQLICDFGSLASVERNMARLLFTDPDMRTLYGDWETYARQTVAALRRMSAMDPDWPQLRELIDDLVVTAPEFAQWWGLHEVGEKIAGTKTIHHPRVGTLRLNYQTLVVNGAPDFMEMFVYLPADSDAHARLRRLSPS
ncbi:helix-turn-helix domain-containing protein [Nocardia sp. ET3-3]|uniref:Helix-turn-helix domain-containing protein n=1 Tax=Nocardia terrae TaxID=2675851 RepID=A0A7K1V462_9NOCA|nr:helix-turn-helix transcriptional regulator [Nocardia terrae]MVU81307.1 helix-turn-helix domain-containing protein [Nocardia terrae]